MKVLIACEFSGAVRDAFTAKGHDAISCDLLPSETPGNHYQGNVFDIIDDGFDLIIGYRNTNVEFSLEDAIVIPDKERIIYLNSASYQNYNSNTYYNVSVDNKIGLFLTDDDVEIDDLFDTGTGENSLLYGALVKENTSSYSNFLNRPYYKEHNNPFLFGTDNVVYGAKIFNGDAQISAMNLVSTVFYDMVVADRAKKSGLWKIIVGAVLIIAAVATTILTAGAATPLAVSLISLAISYGVSLAVAGFKFEQFKNMIEVDYEKGLKDTVTDGGVFETVREDLSNSDDTIRWFADRVSNLYIESTVPFGLRSGITSGVCDFTDIPSNYIHCFLHY